MKILAFDTSNNNNEVAIIEFSAQNNDFKIISSNKISDNSSQAETLVISIEKCLKSANIWYQDLDLITTTKGPGNFTGIRIGFTTAKIIHIAANKPLVTLNNLEILAYNYLNQHQGKILVTLDAKLEEFFVQEFKINNNILINSQENPVLINNQDIENYLKDDNYLIIGSGKEIVSDILQKSKIKHKFNISKQEDDIKLLNLAKLAIKYQNEAPQNIKNEILYVRQPNISKSKTKINQKTNGFTF